MKAESGAEVRETEDLNHSIQQKKNIKEKNIKEKIKL